MFSLSKSGPVCHFDLEISSSGFIVWVSFCFSFRLPGNDFIIITSSQINDESLQSAVPYNECGVLLRALYTLSYLILKILVIFLIFFSYRLRNWGLKRWHNSPNLVSRLEFTSSLIIEPVLLTISNPRIFRSVLHVMILVVHRQKSFFLTVNAC